MKYDTNNEFEQIKRTMGCLVTEKNLVPGFKFTLIERVTGGILIIEFCVFPLFNLEHFQSNRTWSYITTLLPEIHSAIIALASNSNTSFHCFLPNSPLKEETSSQ